MLKLSKKLLKYNDEVSLFDRHFDEWLKQYEYAMNQFKPVYGDSLKNTEKKNLSDYLDYFNTHYNN
jgi:hypothetical protein